MLSYQTLITLVLSRLNSHKHTRRLWCLRLSISTFLFDKIFWRKPAETLNSYCAASWVASTNDVANFERCFTQRSYSLVAFLYTQPSYFIWLITNSQIPAPFPPEMLRHLWTASFSRWVFFTVLKNHVLEISWSIKKMTMFWQKIESEF